MKRREADSLREKSQIYFDVKIKSLIKNQMLTIYEGHFLRKYPKNRFETASFCYLANMC